MKRVLILLAVGGALMVGVADPGMAVTGQLRLSWNDCDPLLVNMDYTTATVYTLVCSVTDTDVQNNGHRTKTKFGNPLAEAWQFWSGGCQTGQLVISHGGASKSCGSFQGTQPLPLFQFKDDTDGQATLDIANAYDLFVPVTANRYTMWKAAFDHGFSIAGDGNPDDFCRFAGVVMCARVYSTEILLVGGASDTFGIENGFVTWNDTDNAQPCPGVQTLDSSWGRVKGLYR